MAFDNSPTQNRVIAVVALATGVILIGLKFIFDSYFVHVMEEETHDRLLPNTEVAAVRAESDKRLAAGNFAQVRKQFEDRGREGFPEIQPKASDDVRALVGWSKLPKPATDVPATTTTATPATSGSTTLTSGSVTPPTSSAPPAHSAVPHTGAPVNSAAHTGAPH